MSVHLLEDFWVDDRPNTIAFSQFVLRRQPPIVPPLISCRSDQVAIDIFKIGANILVDGQPNPNDLDTFVIWVAKIFGVLNETMELEILWYDKTNVKSKNPSFVLIQCDEYITLQIGCVLIPDFKFTSKNHIPVRIYIQAIALSQVRAIKNEDNK